MHSNFSISSKNRNKAKWQTDHMFVNRAFKKCSEKTQTNIKLEKLKLKYIAFFANIFKQFAKTHTVFDWRELPACVLSSKKVQVPSPHQSMFPSRQSPKVQQLLILSGGSESEPPLKREDTVVDRKEGTRVPSFNTGGWRLLDEQNRGQQEENV